MVKEKYITIKTGINGMHSYPNAPKEVEFLKHDHRHYFNVSVTIQVYHDDRELEFYMVTDALDRVLPDIFKDSTSCETYASHILNWLESTYCCNQNRKIKVCVGEDYQNQAEVVNYEL